MNKRVILVTGTPCVGKTTLARQLAKTLNALYVNLTELAEKEHLTIAEDKERQTKIVNEEKMRRKLRAIIDKAESDIIIDGHYAAAVTPKSHVTHVFVLRRNPMELRAFMEKNGFQGFKLWENLASEILDVCLVEAVRKQGKSKVCELDVTGKTVDAVAGEVMAVLDCRKKCRVGGVDWLGMLEAQGVLDEYLRV
jgi:adenylate kinase